MRLSSLLRRIGARSPASNAGAFPLALTLVTRADCPLCDEMKAELRRLAGTLALELREVDVLSDPQLVLRYALRIPVLLLGERVLCEGRATASELERALACAALDDGVPPAEDEGS